MDVKEAFQIVIDLARQNVTENEDDGPKEEQQRQLEALNIIEDLAVNQFGDD